MRPPDTRWGSAMPRPKPGLTAPILLAASLWAMPALADKGDVTCRPSPGYLVVQREMENGRLEFLVKKKARPSDKIACRFVSGPGDLQIGGKGRSFAFIALKSDLLVMRESKGKGKAYKEYLIVFDLGDGAKEGNLGEVHMVGSIGEEEIELAIPSNLEPTKDRCPKYASWFEPDPLGHSKKAVADEVKDLRIEQKAVLKLALRKVVGTPEMECRYMGE
jgi:hypothetical protein